MTPATKLALSLLALGVAACAEDSMREPPTDRPDAKLQDDLRELSRRRIFFGHQSVGENLVDGLQRLAGTAGGEPLTVRAGGREPVAPGTFAHGLVPRNGEPLTKLESFERALAEQGELDIALVKFCYVDIGARTDVRALFAAHEATLARLEEKYPNTTFVRVTVPLHTVQRGPKAMVKRFLGKSTGAAENARREEFNDLLRAATRGEAPLFDLARVESTYPDGRTETERWEGRAVPALVPAYTYDGGHLNEAGKTRAARELVSVLAAAPLRGASARR